MTHSEGALRIDRRFGVSPTQRGCNSGANCPDVLRLSNGDYLVIGDIAVHTEELQEDLTRQGASIGPSECAVVVPRFVIEAAATHIAQAVKDQGE